MTTSLEDALDVGARAVWELERGYRESFRAPGVSTQAPVTTGVFLLSGLSLGAGVSSGSESMLCFSFPSATRLHCPLGLASSDWLPLDFLCGPRNTG
jgi:hypothetical protein